MDRWRADFDNWAIVDTVCLQALRPGRRTPSARVDAWATLDDEFGRRAAFALLASLALHGRGDDADFLARLPLIEAAALDDAQLRQEGRQLGAARHRRPGRARRCGAEARALADRLARSSDQTARWIGKDAGRAFAKADGG